MTESAKIEEPVRWRAYPSWAHFTWLYFFSFMAALRGLLLLRLGLSGWAVWLCGAIVLLVCVAGMRRWGEYIVTSHRVVILNGYTKQEIQSMDISDISEVSLKQGLIGRFFDVGTLTVQSSGEDKLLSLRGIRDPEIIKTRLDALRT